MQNRELFAGFAHLSSWRGPRAAHRRVSGLGVERVRAPMRKVRRAKRTDRKLDRRECEVDAELAAEMACDAASLAIEWAQRSGVAQDDAVEAVRAAARARAAAERT